MVGTEEEEGVEVVLGEVLLEKELVEEEGGVLLGMVQLRCGRNNNNHHDQDNHSHRHMWLLVVVVVLRGVNGWVPRLRGRAGPARLVVLVVVLVVVVEEE